MDSASPRQEVWCVAADKLKWARHVEGLMEKPVGVAVAVSGKLALAHSVAEASWDSQTLPQVQLVVEEVARMGRRRFPRAVAYGSAVESHVSMA